MRNSTERALRILLWLMAGAALIAGMLALDQAHRAAFPALAQEELSTGALFLGMLLYVLGMPFAGWLLGAASGCRLQEMHLIFLSVTGQQGLQVRFTRRFGLGVSLLPPRTDGTSPYVLPSLSRLVWGGLLGGAALLATAAAWAQPAARTLLVLDLLYALFLLVTLLPRSRRDDAISLYLDLKRSREFRRTWECAQCILSAQRAGKSLADMPPEWFLTAPPAKVEHVLMQVHAVNSASYLMPQLRFREAYAIVEPLLALQPAPETHESIACAILNGAICEALADLPPCCLLQLDHPSVRYMTPPPWRVRRLLAEYARTLVVDRDAQLAARLLERIGDAASAGFNGTLIRLLQEKAGYKEEEA